MIRKIRGTVRTLFVVIFLLLLLVFLKRQGIFDAKAELEKFKEEHRPKVEQWLEGVKGDVLDTIDDIPILRSGYALYLSGRSFGEEISDAKNTLENTKENLEAYLKQEAFFIKAKEKAGFEGELSKEQESQLRKLYEEHRDDDLFQQSWERFKLGVQSLIDSIWRETGGLKSGSRKLFGLL